MFNIVLVEPEIPQNTGNIVRTCHATGSALHLVRPLGFAIDDAKLKRAGLDYWHDVRIEYHDSFFDLVQPGRRFYLATTKAQKCYTDFRFDEGDYLVFGKETAGLEQRIRDWSPSTQMRIPMLGDTRSLNLSNAVAIVLYEALRQTGFAPGLR